MVKPASPLFGGDQFIIPDFSLPGWQTPLVGPACAGHGRQTRMPRPSLEAASPWGRACRPQMNLQLRKRKEWRPREPVSLVFSNRTSASAAVRQSRGPFSRGTSRRLLLAIVKQSLMQPEGELGHLGSIPAFRVHEAVDSSLKGRSCWGQ
jgi:hypothetical protein